MNFSILTVYQIMILVLCIIGFVMTYQLNLYYRRSESYWGLLLVCEAERQKLQKKYEGKATPLCDERLEKAKEIIKNIEKYKQGD